MREENCVANEAERPADESQPPTVRSLAAPHFDGYEIYRLPESSFLFTHHASRITYYASLTPRSVQLVRMHIGPMHRRMTSRAPASAHPQFGAVGFVPNENLARPNS